MKAWENQSWSAFFELGWVFTPADIYRLPYDKIGELEGFGPKSVANLMASVEKAKQNPIHRLLHSLSIHHLGQKASKLLAAGVNHVLDLKDWTEKDYTHIKDIGPVVAESVIVSATPPTSKCFAKWRLWASTCAKRKKTSPKPHPPTLPGR